MFVPLFKTIFFHKNKEKILAYCDLYIDNLLNDGDFHVDCKNELLDDIKKEIYACRAEIAGMTDYTTDFSTLAMRMICTHSFEVIESGKYHVFGHFDNTGPGKTMLLIHKKALKYALDHGHCTQEDYDEDLLALRDAMHQYF